MTDSSKIENNTDSGRAMEPPHTDPRPDSTSTASNKAAGDNPDGTPDANDGSPPERPTVSEIDQLKAILNLANGWTKNLIQLLLLETELSAKAICKAFYLKLALVPLYLLLYVSIGLSLSYISMVELQSIYAGIATLLGFQVLSILLLHATTKLLGKLIGFDKTKQKLVEAKNDILAAFK